MGNRDLGGVQPGPVCLLDFEEGFHRTVVDY
jgi:hypothetical protein